MITNLNKYINIFSKLTERNKYLIRKNSRINIISIITNLYIVYLTTIIKRRNTKNKNINNKKNIFQSHSSHRKEIQKWNCDRNVASVVEILSYEKHVRNFSLAQLGTNFSNHKNKHWTSRLQLRNVPLRRISFTRVCKTNYIQLTRTIN